MKLTRYEIRTRTAESRANRSIDMIKPGCTFDFDEVNQDSDLVEAFDTAEAAMAALSSYETYVNFFSNANMQYVSVCEYWIEENVYNVDEGGDLEWIDGGGILEFSAMPATIELRGVDYSWNSFAGRYIAP